MATLSPQKPPCLPSHHSCLVPTTAPMSPRGPSVPLTPRPPTPPPPRPRSPSCGAGLARGAVAGLPRPGGTRPGSGRYRAAPGRADISREKGAGGGIRHCRTGTAGSRRRPPPRRQHGKPGTLVRPQPGGAAEDRPAVRPRAGADPGAVDPGTVRRGRRAASARQGRLPAVAEGRHRAVPAHQQPAPAGPGPGGQDPGVHHGLQADGADLAVPAGGRALRHRRHRHLPDRRPLGREEHGVCAEDPDEPGQPGCGQGRRALRGRPQLVPQEIAGEPARLLRGQAEGGTECHRAADGHQPGRLAGRHDGLRHAPPDPLSAHPWHGPPALLLRGPLGPAPKLP